MLINQRNLKALREARGLSLQQLSDLSNVPVSTIHRMESGKTSSSQKRTVEPLAKALGVAIEDLCGKELPSDHPLLSRRANTSEKSQFNVRISDSARNAFYLVGQRFGLSASEIVEVAPYLMYWAAERSISDRREAIQECADAAGKFESSIPGHMRSELSKVVDDAFLDLACQEEKSLKAGRNIFGEGIFLDRGGYLSYDSNPFATFLRKLADERPEEMEFEGWAPGYAAPSYHVCKSDAETFVGGDSDAAMHLLVGRVAFSEIPKEIYESDDAGSRGAWVRGLGEKRLNEFQAALKLDHEKWKMRFEESLARFDKKEAK